MSIIKASQFYDAKPFTTPCHVIVESEHYRKDKTVEFNHASACTELFNATVLEVLMLEKIINRDINKN